MGVKRLKLHIRKCINLPFRNNISHLIESCFNVTARLPVKIWTLCPKCILNWNLLKSHSHITYILDDESFWNLAQKTTVWYPWRHYRLYEITARVLCDLIPDLLQLYLCAFPFWIRWLFQCLTHWGRDQIDAFSQTTFSNAFSRMKMNEFLIGFHWSLFLRLELIIFQYWFR